jgi:hypothetical protein
MFDADVNRCYRLGDRADLISERRFGMKFDPDDPADRAWCTGCYRVWSPGDLLLTWFALFKEWDVVCGAESCGTPLLADYPDVRQAIGDAWPEAPASGTVMPVPPRLLGGRDDCSLTSERVRWIGRLRRDPGITLEAAVDRRLSWENLPLLERVRYHVQRGETLEALRVYSAETRANLEEAKRVIATLD